METTLFTTFGLLIALMMRQKKKPPFTINRQINLIVNAHCAMPILTTSESHQKQQITPQKKKKPKKNKKLQKLQPEQVHIYPRTTLSDQQIKLDWSKKQAINNIKCKYIGKQIQALMCYFSQQIQVKIPYNGSEGIYTLTIQIPGSEYSDVPIKITINENYPQQLPQLEIGTQNLHPLQKERLDQIIKEHQARFEAIREDFRSTKMRDQGLRGEGTTAGHQMGQKNGHNPSGHRNHFNLFRPPENKSNQIKTWEQVNQPYLQSYYPYALNTCISISQQLFYNPNQILLIQQNKNLQKQKNEQPSTPNPNEPHKGSTNFLGSKNREQIYTDKQILQNVVLEILNLDDDEEKNNLFNMQKLKQFEQNTPKYPNLRGRYKADYEELQMIGEGGFGSVYRCKHRIDSNIYAVKKMVINYNDPQSRKLQKQVELLSKLNHPNIVRYHQSWLQDISSVDELIADMEITDPDQIRQFNKIWKQYSSEHPSRDQNHIINEIQEEDQSRAYHSEEDSVIFGDDIVFGDFSSYHDQHKNQPNNARNNFFFQNQSQQSSSQTEGINSQSQSQSQMQIQISLPRKHSQVHEFPFKILYIVMQYCGSMTLRDFINKKFDQPNDVKIKLIRGILEGLSYIHSRRMMHRDLKPPNIFLIQGMNKVKIGDFGLATIGNIQNNPYQAEILEYSEKTRGVGTSFYRAPEQLSSSSYDEKIDIYSLGIIMLQMFYRFGTNMERHKILNEVTKTHKLPHDFSNNEYNSQFQQQIQSCISVKPSDRPTVQKLLQTFRNKYFTRLVSLIANPKHFQFYQLVNQLFGIKNEKNVIMKQNLFKNYLTYQFTKIYQIHRGVLFTPLSLIPVVDYDTINGAKIHSGRQQKFLLLSQRGVVMQYPSNAYLSWIRYAKQTMKRNNRTDTTNHYKQDYIDTNKQMRRFTFEKVSQFIGGDTKSEFSFKQKYVTAFDIAYEIQSKLTPYFLCQMLKISTLMLETMQLTQKSPPIYLCHSLIFKYMALQFNVPYINVYRFVLSISDEKFRSMKPNLKVQYMKNFGLDVNVGKRICGLMDLEFQDQTEFVAGFKDKGMFNQQLAALIELIQEDVLSTVQPLKTLKLYQRVRWKISLPSANTNGIFWQIGPIKGFTSIQQYLPGQQLCNLHLQTSLNPNPQQNEADVSVWSNGQFLEKQIMEVVAKCWEHQLTAKWYDQNLGEKDLSCRYNIILKKKNQRIYLMLRKNHLNFDRNLEKKNSEELKDKEEKQKESAFILKQHFNFEVLRNLNKDMIRRSSAFH